MLDKPERAFLSDLTRLLGDFYPHPHDYLPNPSISLISSYLNNPYLSVKSTFEFAFTICEITKVIL